MELLDGLFKDSLCRDSYFTEAKMKNILFDKVQFDGCEIVLATLDNVDISSSIIDGARFDLESVKGIIIDQFQAIVMVSLLGVKIKDL